MRIMLNSRYLLLILLLLALATLSCSDSGDKSTYQTPYQSDYEYTGKAYTFKVSHEHHPNDFGSKIWGKLNEALQKYTNGQVKLEIFPFATLYNGIEGFTAVSTRAIDIAGLTDYVPQLWGYTD